MFSNNRAVNILPAARFFLFASRDVWFVVGLPVFLYAVSAGTSGRSGGFLAAWVIGYGIVQASAPASCAVAPRRGRARRPHGRVARVRRSRSCRRASHAL